ncbi:DUF3159 domain-containing protein [Amycolatopsis anabasis]|uniref:DUF3159 domain-containing protein n=1 Tax=Amycolatopsis anabasis TaxID=1840409 RepID=UPI00131CC64B|nr:DUF3159 domain-containing protein [Amycolatopsis anabasis]
MNFTALTQKSLSLFAAVGGWRTVAETVVSRALFVVAYVLSGQVLTAALVAVGGVAVFAVVRVCTDRKFWQPGIGLLMVGLSAFLAGNSGHAVDFYLTSLLLPAAAGVALLVSMLVRWPVIGLVVGAARGERFGWRRDRVRRRRYQLCTAVFLVKLALELAVLAPLYAAGHVVALGIASTLLSTPTLVVCAYLCWRILRTEISAAS